MIHRRGTSYLSKAAQANTRWPFGHPEAFIETVVKSSKAKVKWTKFPTI